MYETIKANKFLLLDWASYFIMAGALFYLTEELWQYAVAVALTTVYGLWQWYQGQSYSDVLWEKALKMYADERNKNE